MLIDNLIWQTRDEMPTPTNPLQRLRETLTLTSRDISEDKMLSFMYGIIVGWDDASYNELKVKFNWTDKDIYLIKQWHVRYCELWNGFMHTTQHH